MNVKNILENYNDYKAEIPILEIKIKELESEMCDIRSANLDGMPKAQGFVASNLEENIIRLQDKITTKHDRINKIKEDLNVTESLIKTLKKYNQEIIELRYIHKISIEEIATKKERGYNSIQKTIEISINKMQKKYDKITNF